MKKLKKSKVPVTKRSLAKELKQGIRDIKNHNSGKITLREVSCEPKPELKINAKMIRDIRLNLHLSQSIFAMHLRVKKRTLEKWEQGVTVPNDQAIALILMTKKYPDTLVRLTEI